MHIILALLLALALVAPPIIGEPDYYGPRTYIPIVTQGDAP